MTRFRLGVVLLLPAPVAAEVDGLRRASGDPALALVPPHVTLVPPVNVRAEAVDDAVSVLRAAAGASRPLPLHIGPAATFHPHTPVLYLAVGGDLEALARLRAAVLAGPLDRPAEWAYVPHVTLATDVSEAAIAAGLVAFRAYSASVTVGRAHLMVEGDDRVWRPLADAGLGPDAVVGRGGLPVELSVTEQPDPGTARWLAGQEGPTSPHGFTITARREGEVVGTALGRCAGDTLTIDLLVVDPRHRAQGIGSHLAAAVEAFAVQEGCRRCQVLVSAGESFYRGRGWLSAGEAPTGERWMMRAVSTS